MLYFLDQPPRLTEVQVNENQVRGVDVSVHWAHAKDKFIWCGVELVEKSESSKAVSCSNQILVFNRSRVADDQVQRFSHHVVLFRGSELGRAVRDVVSVRSVRRAAAARAARRFRFQGDGARREGGASAHLPGLTVPSGAMVRLFMKIFVTFQSQKLETYSSLCFKKYL